MGQGIRLALQAVLGIAIIVLAYFLYVSITEPYQVIKRAKAMTQLTRDRMSDVRSGLIYYERANHRFPMTLDSLVQFVGSDSTVMASSDSLFGADFNLDSLIYSPRSGKPFEYAANDTAKVRIYLLKDPDSKDQIGSIESDITLLNAANWE